MTNVIPSHGQKCLYIKLGDYLLKDCCRRLLKILLQEGPHSCLNEEEFFDAVDASLDKLEKEQEEVRIITEVRKHTQ